MEANCRVGIGYDIHRLVKGRKLILGGVLIPYESGLLGHSDADVLAHAICDALLGALSLGDIGIHFPDNDPKWQGVSSMELLRNVGQLLCEKKARIENIDSVLILETPRIGPYREEMRLAISGVLGVDPGLISIKATTHEGVAEIGRGEAAAAHAVALIRLDLSK